MLEGKVLDDRFSLSRKVGEGTFCSVYLATDQNTLKKVAVKVLKDPTAVQSFRKEIATLKDLQNAPGLAKYYASGTHELNYIVMELLTTDTLQVFKANGALPVSMLLKITFDSLTALESMHSQGYLHLDIKPDNLAIRRKKRRYKCYLVDFGLSQRFIFSGAHYLYAETGEFHGNLVFASVNVLKGCKPSRRDDLLSLMYSIAYLGTSTLPWMNNQRLSFGQLRSIVADQKQTISTSTIFKGLPIEFGQIYDSIKQLDFAEKPNYLLYMSVIESAAKRLEVNMENKREWDRFVKNTIQEETAGPSEPQEINQSVKIKAKATVEPSQNQPFSRDFRRQKTKKLSQGMESIGFAIRSNTRHFVLPPGSPVAEETEFPGRSERGKKSTLVTPGLVMTDQLRSNIERVRREN